MLKFPRINGTRGGMSDDDGVDLDGDGSPFNFVRAGRRAGRSGDSRRPGGGPGSCGALYIHGWNAVPLDGGDGDYAPLRADGEAVPAAPPGAAPAVPPNINSFGFICTKIVFKSNFIAEPKTKITVGTIVLPNPCNIEFIF